MNYTCIRCSKSYKRACDLKQHLQRQENPCDNVCSKCGEKFSSRRVYGRHVAKKKCVAIANCNSINGNNNQITVNQNTVNQNTVNQNTVNQINIQKTDPPTFSLEYLKRAGMCPHETNQDNLLSENATKLLSLIEEHMKTYYFSNNNSPSTDEQHKLLIMKIVELYYSNPLLPHHINIIDNDPDSLYDLLYGGNDFVNDVLLKNERNQRVLQIIYFRLSKFAHEYKIPPIISDYIENELLPHIVRCYFDQSYNSLLQNTWRKNTQLITQITTKLGVIPPCQFNDAIRFDSQLHDMKQKDEYMHKQHNFLRQIRFDNVIRNNLNWV